MLKLCQIRDLEGISLEFSRINFSYISLAKVHKFVRVQIHPSWEKQLSSAFSSADFETLAEFVKAVQHSPLLSSGPLIFEAFNACPFDAIKVVLLGQDPSRSVKPMACVFLSLTRCRILASLINIFK